MPRRTLETQGSNTRPLQPRREPLQERARVRVERILDTTVELLEESDVEALTTAAIAKRAHVPIGSVYHYFASREEILAALVERTTTRVDAAVAACLRVDLPRLPWREALEHAIDVSAGIYASDRTYATVWRATRGCAAFRAVVEASDTQLVAQLAALPLLHERLGAERVELVVRSALRIANTFIDWLLDTPDPTQRARITAEMKQALTRYLAPALD
ncbi:MAG: TetR/AcrR family transcriptional regulator [Myxococcota bacterium]|jgi:AcrR family transcriptional regulator|nr:TetR/AcrR family transcriptional regulator [Myxococcota bacterium]